VNDLIAWIHRYYIDPIIYDTSYNPVDTATWAIVLGLAILGLMRIFRRLDVRVDERLVVYTLPFILAGSSLRVIEDAELVSPPGKYLLITPLIFFLVFLVTAACLLLTRRILGKEFYRGYATIGLFWTAINLAALSAVGFENAWIIAAVFLLGSGLTGGILLLRRVLPWLKFLDNRLNLMIIYAHMLDASSTYLGVDWFALLRKARRSHVSHRPHRHGSDNVSIEAINTITSAEHDRPVPGGPISMQSHKALSDHPGTCSCGSKYPSSGTGCLIDQSECALCTSTFSPFFSRFRTRLAISEDLATLMSPRRPTVAVNIGSSPT